MTTSPPTAAPELVGTSTGQWTLDTAGSTVRLTHPTMWGMVKVKGSFTGLRGQGRVDSGGRITGALTVEAASIDTHNKKRDKHLRSDDFFKAATHPDITFDARSASPDGPFLLVAGELTVAGITRPLQVPVTVKGAATDTVSLEAQFEIDRADFGMTFNQMGMIRGQATLHVVARFNRSGGRD